MSQKLSIVFTISCLLVLPYVAGAVEIAPRISDREIVESLVELKQQQKALNKRMDDMIVNLNKRFESLDKRLESFEKRFESLTNLMVAMFGSVMALIIALVGYMIWDRNIAQKPLREKIINLEENAQQMNKRLDLNNPGGSLPDRLLAAFRELAKTDEKVADVLRSFSLL